MSEPALPSRRPRLFPVILSLAAALTCLALLTLVLRSTGFDGGTELLSLAPPDSWSYEPTGFRGLHDTLGRLGFERRRWQRSYLSLPDPESTVLLTLAPDEEYRLRAQEDLALQEGHAEQLRSWVEEGGTIILALPGLRQLKVKGIPVVDTGELDNADTAGKGFDLAGAWENTTTSFHITHEALPEANAETGDGTGFAGVGTLEGLAAPFPDLPPPLQRALRSYLASGDRPPTFDDPGESRYEPLVLLGGRPLVLESALGRGRVLAASSPLLFSNGGLRQHPVAATTLALLDEVSEEGRKRLLIDEYAHGHIDRGGFLRWVFETPLFYPLMTILLAVLIGAWRGALRLGPPRAERPFPRRAKEEFILNLGQLYERAAHRNHATQEIAQGYDASSSRLLGRPTSGLPQALFVPRATSDDAALLAEAQRLHTEYLQLLEQTGGAARRDAQPPSAADRDTTP